MGLYMCFLGRSMWTNYLGTLHEFALQLYTFPKLPWPQDSEGSIHQLGVLSFPCTCSNQLLQISHVFCLHYLGTEMWYEYNPTYPPLQVIQWGLSYYLKHPWGESKEGRLSLSLDQMHIFPRTLYLTKVKKQELENE